MRPDRGGACRQQTLHRIGDLSRVIGDIGPGESDDPPPVEERLTISLTISGEGIGQLVPSSRIPLDCKTCWRKRRIESSVRIPRKRVLESRLGQATESQDVGASSLKRRSVAGTRLPVCKDRPDLLDSGLAAAGHLVDDPFDRLDLDSLIGDRRLKDRRRMPSCQERGQIHNRSRNRRNSEARNFVDVIISEIVAPMHNHSREEVGRA